MVKKIFTTSDTSMGWFWDWFDADAVQRQEIETLIQSILLKSMFIKAIQLKGKDLIVGGLQLLYKNSPGAKDFVVAAETGLEISYYDLIQEFLPNLTLDELSDLQNNMTKT